MKTIPKLNDTIYTPLVRSNRINGKEQLMWEIETAVIVGIRKSKFEGIWTDEELEESTLYKIKLGREYLNITDEDLENPEVVEGYSFFFTKEEADDYAMREIAYLYYDGNIDEDAFIIENRTEYTVLKMIENYEKKQKEKA